MNRFAFPEPTLVTVEHVNLRDERHGDEAVPAIDIKFSMDTGNDVLAMFHPLLKPMLYFKSSNPAPVAQGALDLGTQTDLPDLRWPHLDPLKWAEELENRTVVIDYGLGGKSSIRLTDCKVNNFRIESKQGGTVHLTWRVQRSSPDERAVGKLSGILKREVHVTITSSPETEALLDGPTADDGGDETWPFAQSAGAVDGEPNDKARKSRKVIHATDAFLAQHGDNGSAR